MIRNFRQSWLKEFWFTGKHKKVPTHLADRLLRKLDMMNSAKELKDLGSPHSSHLHALHGDKRGQFAISVSGQWRLCFGFEDGDIFDIELVQYH